MSYIAKLKKKWEIESNFQVAIIFVVFGLTGSFSVKLAGYVLSFIGLDPSLFSNIMMGGLLYWIIRIIILFPLYQLLLLFFGLIFFQFKFFWSFEKKMLSRMGFSRFFK